MSSELARAIDEVVLARFTEPAAAALATLRAAVDEKGPAHLEVFLAALPRRVGLERAGDAVRTLGEATVDLRAWRTCDLAALDLLERVAARVGSDWLSNLYFRGDALERQMILRSVAVLPDTGSTIRLLQEAHRTNDTQIFCAGFADHDAPARLLDEADFNRGILKAAFIDLPLQRMIGAARRANPTLSAMLLDFMSEREAAGRGVWPGSLELAAHAPCDGVLPRIMGDLWHGHDARRLGATRAAATIASPDLEAVMHQRLAVERDDGIKAVLQAALAVG